jgi:hypothetical protein
MDPRGSKKISELQMRLRPYVWDLNLVIDQHLDENKAIVDRLVFENKAIGK